MSALCDHDHRMHGPDTHLAVAGQLNFLCVTLSPNVDIASIANGGKSEITISGLTGTLTPRFLSRSVTLAANASL
eukprot:3806739-Rhodomonas_salina.2